MPPSNLQAANAKARSSLKNRGTGGFGYDPIFFYSRMNRNMAELSMEEKNRLSHRARAVMNAKIILKEVFGL